MVGSYQVLEIRKILSFGAILGDQGILLPTKYLPRDARLGESVRFLSIQIVKIAL